MQGKNTCELTPPYHTSTGTLTWDTQLLRVFTQANAWADSDICTRHVKLMGETCRKLEERHHLYQQVITEDNFSGHRTDDVSKTYDKVAPNLHADFYPPKLTDALQPIDSNVGKAVQDDIRRSVEAAEQNIQGKHDLMNGIEVKLPAIQRKQVVLDTIQKHMKDKIRLSKRLNAGAGLSIAPAMFPKLGILKLWVILTRSTLS